MIPEEEVKERLRTYCSLNETEIEDLIKHLKFEDNQTDSLTPLEVYTNGHLFYIEKTKRNPVFEKISSAILSNIDKENAGINQEEYDNFCQLLDKLVAHSHEKNCLLYVDAE